MPVITKREFFFAGDLIRVFDRGSKKLFTICLSQKHANFFLSQCLVMAGTITYFFFPLNKWIRNITLNLRRYPRPIINLHEEWRFEARHSENLRRYKNGLKLNFGKIFGDLKIWRSVLRLVTFMEGFHLYSTKNFSTGPSKIPSFEDLPSCGLCKKLIELPPKKTRKHHRPTKFFFLLLHDILG